MYKFSKRFTLISFLFFLLFVNKGLASAMVTGIDSIPTKPQTGRLWMMGGAHAAIWTGCFVALNKAWYADYPKAPFHLFNDNREWLQMDKAGHVWTAYLVTRLSSSMWRWTGLSEKQSVILGGAGAIAFQSIIEIQDGFSHEWGFSLGDMAANAAGAAAYVAQEIAWKEQRILIKFGSFPYRYPTDQITRRNQLFGSTYTERILKDYNSQTYWLSANISSFFPDTRLPRWLNISIGYGGRGMLGGMENKWLDKNGQQFNRSDIARTRHFYLSPDIDLTRIKTSKKWLATVFNIVNVLKIPAPGIEFSTSGKLRLSPLQF